MSATKAQQPRTISNMTMIQYQEIAGFSEFPFTCYVEGYGLVTSDHGLQICLGPARKAWQKEIFDRRYLSMGIIH